MTVLRRFIQAWIGAEQEAGAAAVEYALLAALIAGVIALAVSMLGQEVLAMFQSVSF